MTNHPGLLKAGREADLALFGLLGLNVFYVGFVAWFADVKAAPLLALVPGILLAAALHYWRPAHGLTRYVLALTLLTAVCLQAYYSPGSSLAHANLFVTLCLMLGHEDWRLHVAAGAAFIAARAATPDWWPGTETHLAAIGLGATASDVVMLAALSAVLVFFARRQAQHSNERFELAFLVNAMGQEGAIRLNMDVVLANSTIGSRLKTAQSRMAATLREVRDVVSGVHDVSGELTSMSRELRERTEHTETGLRDAAMSLEQINVIVSASSSAAREARALAVQASEMAGRGGSIVLKVVDSMRQIDSSSRRITDIISVIDTIAFQTNILALNAAVEAARAGEQGRGFAVVAAEVRMLAKRSSEAAKEIKTLIGDSVATVEAGSRLADDAGTAMQELVDAVQRVGAVFDSLTEDTSEHAEGINVVTASVRALDEVTRQNVVVADRSNGIAFELQSRAANLAEALTAFRIGGDEITQSLLREAREALEQIEQQRSAHAERAKQSASAGDGGIEFF